MFKFATRPIRIPEVFKDSLRLYQASFTQLWYWIVLVSIIGSISNRLYPIYTSEQGFSFLGLFVFLAVFAISIFIFMIMVHRVYVVGAQQKVTILDSIKLAQKKFLTALAAGVIITILIAASTLALVFPAIYFFVLLVFYFPSIVIDNEGIFSSMKRSAILVNRHWVRTFILFLMPFIASVLFIAILSLIHYQAMWYETLLDLISRIIFMPYYTATLLVQYNDLKLRQVLMPPPTKLKPKRSLWRRK